MNTDREGRPVRGRGGGIKKGFALTAAALIAGVMVATTAWAMPAGDGVRTDHNISVFHNLDFVAAFGYALNQELTVEVFRETSPGVETRIGVAIAEAQNIDEGLPQNGGLEVNHGPEGPAQDGDCWEGGTPDIRPGDRIVVTGDGGTDQVFVDRITITKGPYDVTSTVRNKTDVAVEGRAAYADGRPIPIAKLDSGELRQAEPRFRATPNKVERIPGSTDRWRATYRAPYRVFQIKDPLTLQQQKRAVLNGDHAMGYGHTEPLPKETQLVEGLGGGGPALGC